MLLKKATTAKTSKQSVEQVKGIYMTKEKRIETRNEISKAHFNFGQPDESKSINDFEIRSHQKI
jgi:hypothetical protein